MRIFIILCTVFLLLAPSRATIGTVTDYTTDQMDDSPEINFALKDFIDKLPDEVKKQLSDSLKETGFQPTPTTTVTITSTSAVTTTATILTTATATVTTTSTVTSTVTAVYVQSNSNESEDPKPQIKIESTIAQSVDLAKTNQKAANRINEVLSTLNFDKPITDMGRLLLLRNKMKYIQNLIEEIEQNSNKSVKLGEFILKVAEVVNEESGPASRNSLRGSVIIRSD